VRGVAFIGGESPAPQMLREIAQGADVLVAVDSGLIACENAGLTPDWILGDMDSLDTLARLDKYPASAVLRFPPDKDFTDTELALNLLKQKGCDEIWLCGGGGGRMDHLLAIRAIFEREDPPDKWFPSAHEVRCLREGALLRADRVPDSVVSVFPLGAGPWKAESSGLKWPLDGLVWEPGSAYISNRALSGIIEVRALQGRFLVILPG